MKIIYCINGTYNSGGMERILMNKANYLADVLGYEVCIVTTEQKSRANFFTFSPKVNFFDLGINYDKDKNIFFRYFFNQFKKKKHRRVLTEFLVREKPDICISMFDRDIDFLYKIKDGSKKILEYHFSKNVKLIESKNKVVYFLQKIRIWNWKKIVQKYERFIVLTEEDKKAWGNIHNICVIPNFLTELPKEAASLTSKRVISVGRLSYQKGFDYLIKIWMIVHKVYPDWQLYIFGNGDKREELEDMVNQSGLTDSIFFKEPTSTIENEYLQSSVYVMSSRYEGLPMVLLEAMSYGLPIVSFTCPCGPRDLIEKTFGSLIPLGDTEAFARELMIWMVSYEKRQIAGKNARNVAGQYLQPKIMERWNQLFLEVMNS